MSPPTYAEQTALVAGLAGLAFDDVPDDGADWLAAAATRLSMIARAQRGGASWNQIAQVTGAENGKAAKAEAHRLARRVQKAMARVEAAAVLDDDLEDS